MLFLFNSLFGSRCGCHRKYNIEMIVKTHIHYYFVDFARYTYIFQQKFLFIFNNVNRLFYFRYILRPIGNGTEYILNYFKFGYRLQMKMKRNK